MKLAEENKDAVKDFQAWTQRMRKAFMTNGTISQEDMRIALSGNSLASFGYNASLNETGPFVLLNNGDDDDDNGNTRPTVNARNKFVRRGTTTRVSNLFSVTDAEKDRITKYRFFETDGASGTGSILINGVKQDARKWHEVSSFDLSSVRYRSGGKLTDERLKIRAYDGKVWSRIGISELTTVRKNTTAPVTTVRNFTVVEDESVYIKRKVTAVDKDNFRITRYRLKDTTDGNKSGFFKVGNKTMKQGKTFTIDADELGRVRYIAGSDKATETYEFSAFDGKWSKVRKGEVSTKRNANRPVINYKFNDFREEQVVDIFTLFDPRDEDENTFKKVRLYDNSNRPDSGSILYQGREMEARKWHTFNTSKVGDVEYQAGIGRHNESMRVQIYDGKYWSDVEEVDVKTQIVPRLRITDSQVRLDSFQAVEMEDVIQKLDKGTAHTKYEFFDYNADRGSARLVLDGEVLNARTRQIVNPDQLEKLTIVGGQQDARWFDNIYVRANNGNYWGDWENIHVITDPNADAALTIGLTWYDVLPVQDDPLEITYTFMEVFPTYYDTFEEITEDTFVRYTPEQKNHIRSALRGMEEHTNVKFVEVGDDLSAIVRISAMIDPEAPYSGVAVPPFTPDEDETPYGIMGDTNLNFAFGNDLSEGGAMRTTFLHEMGHVMGMAHPHDPPILLPNATDSDNYTVMSYNGHRTTAVNVYNHSLYDIQWLQNHYGANNDTRTGNDVYSWENGRNFGYTIWDAGGDADWIDTSNQTLWTSTINLQEGGFSTIGRARARTGGRGRDNVSIAYGAEIENAKGTNIANGGDTLIGNHLANILVGLNGDDRIAGGRGHGDVLKGGGGNDTYVYQLGDGNDIIRESKGGGRDVLEIHSHYGMSNLNDVRFKRAGNDMIIDLHINNDPLNHKVTIKDMAHGGSRVETLRLFDRNGDQVLRDVDLSSVFFATDSKLSEFRITGRRGQFGALAAKV